jgi:hypothetical protein
MDAKPGPRIFLTTKPEKSKSLFKNSFVIRNLGAFLAQSAKNRAFRCKSSEAPMRFLWAFRYNPLRGGSDARGPVAYRLFDLSTRHKLF